MRKLFIIAILALLPLSAFAWGVVSISGGVAAGETNYVLCGNDTDLSGGSDGGQAAKESFVYSIDGADFTAEHTGTLRYGYLRVGNSQDGGATVFKIGVYVLSSGTTYNLVEISSATSFSANSLLRVNFSGNNTITQGQSYVIGYVADSYMYTKRGTATWSHMEDSSGSYASPPSSVTSPISSSAFAEMEIYVTNYIQ